MRRVKIFSGSSNAALTDAICERLGTNPSKCELRKFSNGETSVQIGCSIREQDVFIVQGGSSKVNDHLMETLILISACKGGSANKVTAVIPYFPYSKQSKKKAHRGAITARMVANLLTIAGVDHVVTVDLHASQMQGFFTRPVDNLSAEPLIAKWIRNNIPTWRDAVIVSKNPGGTKRVTSLADALKLNFALITTDKRRAIHDSAIHSRRHSPAHSDSGKAEAAAAAAAVETKDTEVDGAAEAGDGNITPPAKELQEKEEEHKLPQRNSLSNFLHHRRVASGQSSGHHRPSNLSTSRSIPHPDSHLSPSHDTSNGGAAADDEDAEGNEGAGEDEFNDEQVQEVTTGRLVQGHIVEDDYDISESMTASVVLDDPSSVADMSASGIVNPMMLSSVYSTTSSVVGMDSAPLGGTIDARESDDEDDQHMAIERMITLVGEVKGRVAIIVDDMIDRPGSWIAAAEHAVMRCYAKKVYCIATHGVFGEGCLKEMEECKCIHQIVVTNSFPVTDEMLRMYRKLKVLDLSHLLSEAIRRNHHGEPISTLFQHFD